MSRFFFFFFLSRGIIQIRNIYRNADLWWLTAGLISAGSRWHKLPECSVFYLHALWTSQDRRVTCCKVPEFKPLAGGGLKKQTLTKDRGRYLQRADLWYNFTWNCLKFLVDKPRSKTWYIVIHLWLRYSFTSFNITTQNVIFSGRGVRPSCNIHQTEKFKFWQRRGLFKILLKLFNDQLSLK